MLLAVAELSLLFTVHCCACNPQDANVYYTLTQQPSRCQAPKIQHKLMMAAHSLRTYIAICGATLSHSSSPRYTYDNHATCAMDLHAGSFTPANLVCQGLLQVDYILE